MIPYVIQQGDFLERLAYRFGFTAKSIWNHPKNQALRDMRGSGEVLCPGDLLFFPKPVALRQPISGGTGNTYIMPIAVVDLDLRFCDAQGAWANETYTMVIGGQTQEGTTDGDGILHVKVPVTARAISIRFDSRHYVEEVQIGHLDPITESTGVRQRLDALGYFDNHHDDFNDEAFALAVLRFQQANKLTATGKLDEKTLNAIAAAHGS